jgi:hypothetical protein
MALLPGQTFSNNASNYVFGTNTPNYDTSLLTDTQIQTQMSTAGITVIRTALGPPTGNYTDSQLDTLATAISNAGAKMLAILPHNQSAFAQHVVSYLGSRCLMYEYSNERDINGESWQTYLSEWNAIIPLARAANPSAVFIGPVLGAFSNVNSYLVPWLQGCKSSGVLPDAISVHIYPCTGGSIPQQTCLSRASGIGASVAGLRTTVQNILGYNVPLCLTEWNADAYYANPTSGNQAGQGYNSNAASNNTFNSQFAIQALEGFVANGVDMACHFELDYFMANKSGLISTAPQYTAMASEVAKYFGGGATVGSISVSPSTLSVSAPVNGVASTQFVTLKNSGTASGTFTNPITYSAYGNLNWIAVSSSTTTIASGASQSVFISTTPQIGMASGTYTATITFTMGTSTASLTVTLTITGASSTTSHIYVPTNSYPTDPSGTSTTWGQYETGSPAVSFIVANPAGGPGASADANFTTGIANMHTSGVKVLGYVNSSSSGTLVPLATVETQIDSWYSFYSIDGIQLDNVLATSTNQSYYQSIFTYVRGKDAVRNAVMLNVNAVPPEAYVAIADTIVVFQGSLGNIGQFIPQSYMANYPASKFAATVTGVTTTTVVDSTVSALQAANIGYIFTTDQTTSAYTTPPGTTVWNELIKDSNVGASTGGSTGGSSGTTAFSVYLTGTAATTITTANLLYAPSSAGSPTTTWKYSRVSTATGYGEITSQGTTGAWAAAGSLPVPTGKGFLYDVTSLEGQQIVAGNWSAAVRLNCAQSGDTNPQLGTLSADIIVRAFKVNGSTYTPIVSMTLGTQTIAAGYATFTLPSTPASAMSFASGDKLYLDIFLNVTANANASSVQDVRLNRESTDTSTHTGDAAATIGTPGYATATSVAGGTGTTSASDTFVRANQSGWGTASDGETWTTTGTGTQTIVSNEGVLISTLADTNVRIGTNTLADVDIRCRITVGAGLDIVGIEGRYSVSGGNVTCYKLVWASGTLLINKCIAGVNTNLATVGYTVAAGVINQYHLRIQGSNIYANLYPDGPNEPSVWMLTATDSSISAAGGYAVLGNTNTGSPGIQFDHFSANAVTATVTTPALTATPATLALSGTQGGGTTGSQFIALVTNSATSGAWTATATYNNGYGWLVLTPASGTLSASSTIQVGVSASSSGLAPGTYTASLVFACGTASQTVLITFVIAPTAASSLAVVLTSAGKTLIAHGITGADNPRAIYFALGTGTTAPSTGDTQLVNEIFRKEVTSASDGVNPGEILVNCYIAANDVVGVTIQEVGVFGGNAAGVQPNTGVLLARGLYFLNSKTNLESAQLVLDLQIQ